MQATRYHVVKFLKLPYIGCDEYVCVPESWIRLCDKDRGKFGIAYPTENTSETDNFVRNGENPLISWNIHEADVKYVADSYDAAMCFIKAVTKTNSENSSLMNEIIERMDEMSMRMRLIENEVKSLNNARNLRPNSPVPSTSRDVPLVPEPVGNDDDNAQITTDEIDDIVEGEPDIRPVENEENAQSSLDEIDDNDEGEIDRPVENDENNADERNEGEENDQPARQQIIYPPEYNPNDSRWTLKYREQTPDLTDLIPGRGIFVRTRTLQRIQTASTTYNILARKLLKAIFRLSALRICTLTGRPSNAHKDNTIRPGLNANAVSVLIDYAEQYGNTNGWNIRGNTVSRNDMKQSLGSKLKEIRRDAPTVN